MKTLLKMLGLSEDASLEAGEKALGQKLLRLKALEPLVEAIAKGFDGAEPTVEQVRQLVAESADGRAYKSAMVDDLVKAERLAKHLGDDQKEIDARKQVLTGRTLADLKQSLAPFAKTMGVLGTQTIVDGAPGGDRHSGQKDHFMKEG